MLDGLQKKHQQQLTEHPFSAHIRIYTRSGHGPQIRMQQDSNSDGGDSVDLARYMYVFTCSVVMHTTQHMCRSCCAVSRYVSVEPASSHSPDGSFRNQVSTPAAWIMCRALVSNESLAARFAGEGLCLSCKSIIDKRERERAREREREIYIYTHVFVYIYIYIFIYLFIYLYFYLLIYLYG